MESSEEADLDSLFALIAEEDSTCSTPGSSKAREKSDECETDLDSLFGLIAEEDSSCNPSESSKVQEKSVKLCDLDFAASTKDCDNKSSLIHADDSKSSLTHTGDDKSSLIHTGDTSSEEEEYLTEGGTEIKEKIKTASYYQGEHRRIESRTWRSKAVSGAQTPSKEEPLDKLTGIRIVNPLVAFDVMEKRLQSRKLIRMSLLKRFVNKKNDIEGDWVTVGVVVRKIPPKTSKTGKLFSIWKLSDLHDTDRILSLFLFGQVHTEHWKTAVGTVVGILNPTLMEPNDRETFLSISLDHPGKLMLIGTSKDLGQCKSSKKDGTKCGNIVNLSQCQYCTYHVKSEYKKFGSQRSDIQSSWSGSGLRTIRDKVLKGHNFFYGGQTFTPLGKQEKKTNKNTARDKLTLANLTLNRKVATVIREEKPKSVDKIFEKFGEAVSRVAEKNSEFINHQLLIPSAGSRNLLGYMMKNKTPEEKSPCVQVSHPRELLKQQMIHKKDDSMTLRSLEPKLGKGLDPRQMITFHVESPNSSSLAKIKAIQKIRETGPIKRKNPNDVKSAPEAKKIKVAQEDHFEGNLEEKGMIRSKLGCIDLNSAKIQRILNQKSSHAYEVEMAEMAREAAYFDRLEKREAMEEKMSATREIVCDVVSCKQCRYTAHKAADRCKDEAHPLKCHKAVKRFFVCKDCKRRTECFSRFPHTSCRVCGGSRFERTGMMKVRSGPKLVSETLRVTGDDTYWLNSL